MKKHILLIISTGLFLFTGCQNLEFNPLTEGSTENWFSSESEFELAVNELYRHNYWYFEVNRFSHTDRWSDDWNQRDTMYDYLQGNYTSDYGQVHSTWYSLYAGVTRANTILLNIKNARGKGYVSETMLDAFEGEASFFRACFYAYLVFLWGDVPFYLDYLYLEDAFQMSRTDKSIVMQQVYTDFDRAAELLPATYPTSYSDLIRVTKGAAYGYKARSAIWMLDWETAAAAAKDCIDLGVYSLHPDFGELFLSRTRTSPEHIFVMPRSKAIMGNNDATGSRLPRNVGGNATAQPSWELFCSYLCTDGLPIDKSPLYDPQNPFLNRDPRCAETMVEIGSDFLGYIYSPGTAKTINTSTGLEVTNNDTRLNQTYSSFNGMCLKKGVDESWVTAKDTDFSYILLRYADVLLMYAEAKIELNEIDASVLQAINMVRSRAYGVSYTQTGSYPSVTETDQGKLRTIVRMERRMELAWENRRWFDLIRWRLAEVALTRPIYCHDQAAALKAVIESGDYFFPKGVLPVVDENGLVDLSPLHETGKVIIINVRGFQNRQYLLPIPDTEIEICPNLKQNDDY